ncbi:regulator of hypoxia-inducible factor 1-like isoform X2 [Ochlerotatus camptorhynchus]|uniref:regulator of hypoxia-inducible factor 1-like isoform X2 n=1 Tax=Ochlerotatus camptorhynchus TaxID=644619 RepID=UPI0031D0BC4C
MQFYCGISYVLLLVLGRAFASNGDGSTSNIIPPIYRYDDFDKCRQVNSPGVFCYVRVVLKSDVDPIDSDRIVTNFRRNQLDWGVCVADCERELAALGENDRQRLFQAQFEINHTYIFRMDYAREIVEPFKLKYSKLINVCVNRRLERNYQLSHRGYSEIEYCISNDPLEARSDLDWLTVVFLTIVVTLVSTVVGANAVEWLAGDKRFKDHIIVSSFSLRRNWSRFIRETESEVYKEFGYIDGLRVFINIYVLIIHCLLVFAVLPLTNPEAAEQMIQSRFMVNFASTAPLSVQTFFVISGLLLMVNFLKDIERRPQFSAEYFHTKIINRWLRILPVYYFFLLLAVVGHAIPGLRLGPLGYLTLITERNICRDRAWYNVFFVNNLPLTDERCFLHGWYLGADQQLFMSALVVLAVIWKHPKITKPLLVALLVTSVALPAGLIYQFGLESVLPLRLSDLKFLLSYQDWFKHIYSPSYTNANSFIGGMIVGYLYHETKRGRLNLDDSKLFKLLRKLIFPILVLGLLSSSLFYEYEHSRSSWWIVLHSVLYRNYGVMAGCMLFIHCFRNQPGSIRRFLASRPMTTLGKLSYSVYVLHVPLVRLLVNYLPGMPELSVYHITLLLMVLVGLSYAMGMVVYFCLEQPASLILKYWFIERRKTKVV